MSSYPIQPKEIEVQNPADTEQKPCVNGGTIYNPVISSSDSSVAFAISAMGSPICFILRATA